MQFEQESAKKTPVLSIPDRYNTLLVQFRLYWNVYQFYSKLDETIRASLAYLNAGFLETFQKFKQCKTQSQVNPDSDLLRAQLDIIEQDMAKLRRGLHAADDTVPVDRIRCGFEGTEQLPEGLCHGLVTYYISKEFKSDGDRDKVDYLITLCFQRENPSLVTLDNLETLSRQVSGFLGEQRTSDQLVPPEHLKNYLFLVREVQNLGEFNSLLNQGVIASVREFKNTLGDLFYHPAILSRIIVLNVLMRHKFQSLLEKENKKTEEQIIKLAEIGGEILMGNSAPESSALSLLDAKEKRDNLTAQLHQEYSRNQEKFRQLEQIGDLLDRTFTFYGLNDGQSPLGGKGNGLLHFQTAATFEGISSVISPAASEVDEVRKVVSELEMMVRAHARRGASATRFKFREVLMILSPWETEAFLDMRPGPELHMRIRQVARRTVGLIFLIQDLLRQGQEHLGASLPRGMLLSMEYALLQAQSQRRTLEDLVAEVVKRAMKFEAFHLANLQARLTSTVSSVKPLFQKEHSA